MATADSLANRIDALAVALRDAGLPPDRIATILGTAATATMNALLLDAVLDENAQPPATPDAPTIEVEIVEQPLRVAA